MDHIMNIFSTLFFLMSAVYGYLFYKGRLKLSDEKENIRKERVKKYKWLLITSIIVLCLSGLGMLLVTMGGLFRF